MARQRRTSPAPAPLRFDQRLVLTQWLLSLFQVARFEDLAKIIDDPRLEGFDEDGTSRFHKALATRLFQLPELPIDLLLAYDQNIVRYWRAITANRRHDGRGLFPKYFQYLALLFTEIYLDRYFGGREALLDALNAEVARFNDGAGAAEALPPYQADDLNKLAFWMATGSGKTLLMHVNILQFRHYLAKYGRERELNRILLLTPNEGLSRQHLEEFAQSGIEAEAFSKDGRGLFSGNAVEVIEVTKLAEEMGVKQVAVEAFEGNNLVLVDEGHRGTSGEEEGAWMRRRNALCEHGFSFEYSATFGQAVSKNNALRDEYARCIVFDYSYKYFYKDGYGKDYHILNLADDSNEDIRQLYLTACLLAFFQQLKLYEDRRPDFTPFLIENPLWVFVGGSVTKGTSKQDLSDTVEILKFLAGFVGERAQSEARLERLLKGKAGLLDREGHEIFHGAFSYLLAQGVSASDLFEEILRVLFNAPAQAAFHVQNLKGVQGEIALRLGENPPFGVINVGDDAKLCKLCEDHAEFVVEVDQEFSGSLFQTLNDPESPVHILIGSKKFSEGWNSWRVSTMGLMNVGKNEGSQIIQLFGRGVRLKGYAFGLKRSQHVHGVPVPKHMLVLETLNIFGIHSDYMRQFKEYLEEEGLPSNEKRIEFVLPTLSNLGTKKLRMVRLKEGLDFKKDGPKPVLEPPPRDLLRFPVVLDWYPIVESRKSRGLRPNTDIAEKKQGRLGEAHLAFLDADELFFELEQFKNERSWHNLEIPRNAAMELLEQDGWYQLFIPPEELEFHRFDRTCTWREIALALLKKYCDRYYKFRKAEWEGGHLEYRDLAPDDPNFVAEYHFLLQESAQDILNTLNQVKTEIQAGALKGVEMGNLSVLAFGQHLYEPLIYLNSEVVEVKPTSLNQGERDFVLDLKSYYEGHPAEFAGKELYLLRNMSRGRGIGFFEAGNFYPDFILWILSGGHQYVSFIDPHGLRHSDGPQDPKVQFHKTIKDLEAMLKDTSVTLSSFILSQTPFHQVSTLFQWTNEAEAERHYVFFKQPGDTSHLGRMLAKAQS